MKNRNFKKTHAVEKFGGLNSIGKGRNSKMRSLAVALICGIFIIIIGISLKYVNEVVSGMTQIKGAGWRHVVMNGNLVIFLGILYTIVVLIIWKLDKR